MTLNETEETTMTTKYEVVRIDNRGPGGWSETALHAGTRSECREYARRFRERCLAEIKVRPRRPE